MKILGKDGRSKKSVKQISAFRKPGRKRNEATEDIQELATKHFARDNKKKHLGKAEAVIQIFLILHDLYHFCINGTLQTKYAVRV